MDVGSAVDHLGTNDEPLTVADQVSLAVRAGRRAAGLSQRALAVTLGWSAAKVERMELDAGSQSLRDVVRAVEHAGYELVVARAGQPVHRRDWEVTDLVARDRGGRRFPAHRTVRAAVSAPFWWWDQEFLRLSRPLGPRPRWTTEGSLVVQLRRDLRPALSDGPARESADP